jgi:hypothetical protein
MKNAIFWDVTPCGSCKTPTFRKNIASIMRRDESFHPDDGGDALLRNVYYKSHTASQSRRRHPSTYMLIVQTLTTTNTKHMLLEECKFINIERVFSEYVELYFI